MQEKIAVMALGKEIRKVETGAKGAKRRVSRDPSGDDEEAEGIRKGHLPAIYGEHRRWLAKHPEQADARSEPGGSTKDRIPGGAAKASAPRIR